MTMANYQVIARLRPEVRDFIRNRRWVHSGGVITYGPGISCDSFSTDRLGFRHSTFNGRDLSVVQCVQNDRYGVVLGPSSVYGFGLAGNANTIPSLLAERFGFPFANIGLPEGNSRNLFAILMALIARAPKPPSAVVHVSGGDFTNFCYTSIADGVFGSPNLKQIRMALKERGGRPPAEGQIPALLSFTSLWIRSIAEICRGKRIPLVLADDTTFFEKANPSEEELLCALGSAFNQAQEQQFATHKRFVSHYHARRKAVAKAIGVPLSGPGISNDIGFIDEFHYDAQGTRALTDDYARTLERML